MQLIQISMLQLQKWGGKFNYNEYWYYNRWNPNLNVIDSNIKVTIIKIKKNVITSNIYFLFRKMQLIKKFT